MKFAYVYTIIIIYLKKRLKYQILSYTGDLFWTDAVYSGNSWIWVTTHSKVNSELSHYLASTHSQSRACAVAGEMRFSRALLAISCDAKYKPMCNTL